MSTSESVALDPNPRVMTGLSPMERLVAAVQELSLARDLETVMRIVRRAARELTGADGATFVLRDGDFCHYVDEDAISPLWKGMRFPMEMCISGWAMLHRQAAVIEDIYADPRVPADAYRPTFVKSLVMVPIRTVSPVGAIGNYWATRRRPHPEEVRLLAALADSTSIAMENVALYQSLERRVAERTRELEQSRAQVMAKHEALQRVQQQKDELAELLVHDLKSPANGILMACRLRLRDKTLPDADRRHWKNVQAGAEVIDRMALNILDVSRSDDGELVPRTSDVPVGKVLSDVVELMTPLAEGREQRLVLGAFPEGATLRADAELVRRVLQNLTDNALRHNPPGGTVRIEARARASAVELCVVDEGPGIPAHLRESVFERYRRLDPEGDTAGSAGRGLGLAFCRLAVECQQGAISIESNAPRGTVFVVRLPAAGAGL